MKQPPDPNYRHRFPAEIISRAVWLHHAFSLSLRDVALILAERGVLLTYETVRRWCRKFGQSFANSVRRRRRRPGDKWHLDEVFVQIQGELHYLWRAVDQDGVVLDILVQSRRNAKAAQRFFKRLLRGLQYAPRVIVTDKLKSYGAAKRASRYLTIEPRTRIDQDARHRPAACRREGQPGRPAPDDNITVDKRHSLRPVHALRAAEQ